jgi:hypothetical protein
MKMNLSDYVPMICGYLAWSGGDSAVFDFVDISSQLRLEIETARTALDYMLDRGFLVREGGKCRLTKQGSFFVDFSLFEIIVKWAYKAELDAPYPLRTLQWMFLRSKFFPRKPPYGIRSAYVLDFCSSFLKYLTEKTSYTMSDYSLFREFIMRASLRPTFSFLTGSSDARVRFLIERLVNARILRIDSTDESLLLFNTGAVKVGESYGGTKRKDKEKA